MVVRAGNSRLNLTVASKTARWLVRRRGGGGRALRAGNRAEAVRRRRNAAAEIVVSGGGCGRARLPFGFSKGSERERMGSGVEAEARAWCCGATRVGATSVHAVDDAGMRPPRGVVRLRAVGRGVTRARDGEACGVGWAAGAGRAEARRERAGARPLRPMG
jgi:hypothetical protein